MNHARSKRRNSRRWTASSASTTRGTSGAAARRIRGGPASSTARGGIQGDGLLRVQVQPVGRVGQLREGSVGDLRQAPQEEEFKEMDCFECKYNPWDEWGSCEKDPWGTCVKHRKRDVVKMPDYETAKFNKHGDYCQCQWDTESCPEEQCAR